MPPTEPWGYVRCACACHQDHSDTLHHTMACCHEGIRELTAPELKDYAQAHPEQHLVELVESMTDFHKFFEDKCELLYMYFGLEAIEAYNRVAGLALLGKKT